MLEAPDASWYYSMYEKNESKELKLPAGNLGVQLRGAGTGSLEYGLLVPSSKHWK